MVQKRAPSDPRGDPSVRGRVGCGVLASILLLSALAAFFFLPTPATRGQVLLDMTMGDFFFEPNTFRTDPGDNVTMRLVNSGITRHTFTLFDEANASVPVNDDAALQDFYARAGTLLDHSLDGGEEVTVNFTVPDTVGVYTLVCIVPNHAALQGMHGLMFVGMVAGNGDLFGGIGIIQGLLIATLLGVVVFAVVYHVRSTRP